MASSPNTWSARWLYHIFICIASYHQVNMFTMILLYMHALLAGEVFHDACKFSIKYITICSFGLTECNHYLDHHHHPYGNDIGLSRWHRMQMSIFLNQRKSKRNSEQFIRTSNFFLLLHFSCPLWVMGVRLTWCTECSERSHNQIHIFTLYTQFIDVRKYS